MSNRNKLKVGFVLLFIGFVVLYINMALVIKSQNKKREDYNRRLGIINDAETRLAALRTKVLTRIKEYYENKG